MDLLGLAQLEVDVVVHDHDQAALGVGDPGGELEPGLLVRRDAESDQRIARTGKCVSEGVRDLSLCLPRDVVNCVQSGGWEEVMLLFVTY